MFPANERKLPMSYNGAIFLPIYLRYKAKSDYPILYNSGITIGIRN